MKLRPASRVVIGVLFFQGVVWAGQPVAYITEIHKPGKSDVRVRTAGKAELTVPQPLLALQSGDEIQVSGDARIVVLYHSGAGTQTVTSANSPFTVQAPASGSPAREQLAVLMERVSEFLIGKQGPPKYKRLSARSPESPEGQSPVILSPRESRLLPGPVIFEWQGSDKIRYSIRVSGPQGLLWELGNLPRRPLSYPENAPALIPGVVYLWELEAQGQPVERARFEILSKIEAARIREALAPLERASLEGYSRGTVTVMRAALLFQEGLYMEARRELDAALSVDRDDQTFHLLLGHVYQRIGLNGKAALAFGRARDLSWQP